MPDNCITTAASEKRSSSYGKVERLLGKSLLLDRPLETYRLSLNVIYHLSLVVPRPADPRRRPVQRSAGFAWIFRGPLLIKRERNNIIDNTEINLSRASLTGIKRSQSVKSKPGTRSPGSSSVSQRAGKIVRARGESTRRNSTEKRNNPSRSNGRVNYYRVHPYTRADSQIRRSFPRFQPLQRWTCRGGETGRCGRANYPASFKGCRSPAEFTAEDRSKYTGSGTR